MSWWFLLVALAAPLEEELLTREPVVTRAGTLHLMPWPGEDPATVAAGLWRRLTERREDPEVRAAVAALWIRLDGDEQKLTRLWEQSGTEVREAMLVVGPRHGRHLLLAWGLQEPALRLVAARGLARFPGAVDESVLRSLMADEDPDVREQAALALRRRATL